MPQWHWLLLCLLFLAHGAGAMELFGRVVSVTDGDNIFLISGNGDVIEPDDNIIAIGSGGAFALAAARALVYAKPEMSAEEIAAKSLEIAADICVFTNDHISIVSIK